MKLYDLALSPFSARCRIAIYAKRLDVALEPPPGGLSSTAYKALNPTGRVPALDVDGTVIPESQVICEFLEDRYPYPALRPAEPLARARDRAIARVADLDLVPLLQTLFGQVNPKTRDPAVVEATLGELRPKLDQLERLLGRGPFAEGESLGLADCALFPLFFFATRMLPMLGDKDPLAERSRLARWWEAVQKEDAVAKVDAELQRALTEYMRGQA